VKFAAMRMLSALAVDWITPVLIICYQAVAHPGPTLGQAFRAITPRSVLSFGESYHRVRTANPFDKPANCTTVIW